MAKTSPAPLLILGSSSPRRSSLLKELGVEFTIQASPFREPPPPANVGRKSPKALVKELSLKKALAFPSLPGNPWILTADTLVFLGREVLGKPRSETMARAMLKRLSGRTHSVWTGVTLLRKGERNEIFEIQVETNVTFARLSPNFIRWYVETGEPMDKAGAYGAQGIGTQCIKKIEGSYTNVVGLPLSETIELLEKAWQLGRELFLRPEGMRADK